MNRPALAAAALVLAGATPAFAAGECLYLGTPSSQGALICQAGTISQCKAGRWLPTKKACKAETAIAHKVAPVAAPSVAPALPPPPVPVPQTGVVAPPPAPNYLLHILTASYAAGSSGEDVVFSVRELCEGKPVCSFIGDVKFLRGDPAPREQGRFSINYRCTTGFQSQDAQHVVFAKNATILLSCRP